MTPAQVTPLKGGLLTLLLLAALLAGCAGAPRVPAPPAAVPPAPLRSPQEMALEEALREFLRAPYRVGGTTPAGVDCSGLVLAVYQRLGIHLPRSAAEQFEQGRPVPLHRLRFGDVVFFNRYCQLKPPEPRLAHILPRPYLQEVCHNGIYLGNGRFLHASPRGVEVGRLDAEVWRLSFLGARRYLKDD